jgi:hypothetical protein
MGPLRVTVITRFTRLRPGHIPPMGVTGTSRHREDRDTHGLFTVIARCLPGTPGPFPVLHVFGVG